MKLEFKADFEQTAAEWRKFWDGSNRRPAVSAIVPKPGVTPVAHPGAFAILPEQDPGPVIDQLLGWAATHDFLYEAIPFYYLQFAAEHFAALVGADLAFSATERGGWAVPFVTDLAHADIHFDRDGYWWRQTVEAAQALRERCDGKLLIAAPTLSANVDALAAICGTDRLLMAMVDEPEAVHAALEQVDRAHRDILEALAGLLDYDRLGSINRHGMYSPGRINVPQCDFSCMIGPDMFREFVMPYLQREMRRLDAVEYHLDGPDAIKHLEALCGLEELGVIQWVPGAGAPSQRPWDDLYQRIDDQGKGQLRHAGPEAAKQLWKQYRTRRLFLNLGGRSRADIDACVAELERLTPLKPDPVALQGKRMTQAAPW